MASRRRILFLRQIALALVTLFATAGVGFASQGGANVDPAATGPRERAIHTRQQKSVSALTVPRVERRPYVFAKGLLQEAGFAWRVVGPVRGFPSNFVLRQYPSAGTAVVDNGAPTITLVLERNMLLPERGVPIPRSPYRGTRAVSAPKS